MAQKKSASEKSIPLVIRYNNPGALRDARCRYYYDEKTQSIQLIQSEKNKRAYNIFKTQEDGVIALGLTLLRYKEKGRCSINAIIKPYAPASDGNNTSLYIRNLCKEMNASLKKAGKKEVTPSTPLDLTDPDILCFMAQKIGKLEGIKDTYSEEVFRSGTQKAVGFYTMQKKIKENAKNNPFYPDESNKKETICQLPSGQKVTLWDVGRAVQEGKISFEQAVLLRYIAAQTSDKSQSAIQTAIQIKSKALNATKKEVGAALSTVVENTVPHVNSTLGKNAISYQDPNVNLLVSNGLQK